MRSRFHRLYPVLALAVLAAGTVWLERVTRLEEPRTAPEARSAPDFITEQARIRSFDESGRQRYVLLAETITHYPHTRTTVLDRPRLQYQGEGRELTISARTAELDESGEEVRFRGDVDVERPAAAGKPATRLRSQSLTVWPDARRAESREPVLLTRGASTVRARGGMKADDLYGNYQFFGGVSMQMPRASRN